MSLAEAIGGWGVLETTQYLVIFSSFFQVPDIKLVG